MIQISISKQFASENSVHLNSTQVQHSFRLIVLLFCLKEEFSQICGFKSFVYFTAQLTQ